MLRRSSVWGYGSFGLIMRFGFASVKDSRFGFLLLGIQALGALGLWGEERIGGGGVVGWHPGP